MATEEEVKQAKSKAEAMELENTELSSSLLKKEQELEQQCQEKVNWKIYYVMFEYNVYKLINYIFLWLI